MVLQNNDRNFCTGEESTLDDSSAIEYLMQNHDVLLSTFKSRLTKLQVFFKLITDNFIKQRFIGWLS